MLKEMLNILGGMFNKNSTPSLDAVLASMDSHLTNFDSLMQPAPESKPRTPFDAHLPRSQMSLANLKPRQRMRVLPQMAPLLLNMQVGAQMYDGKPPPQRTEVSPEFISDLEALAYKVGVKDIRYVKVPPNAIFKGKGLPGAYAVVYTVEMNKEPLDTSPGFESQLEVMKGYKNLAIIGNRLARFMHKAGFAAYPGTGLGGITDYVYLAELAGLGAIGYHGLLITPGEGARLRINTIYTNITNLPVRAGNEHRWVRDFCAMCRKCVRECPVSAIKHQPEARGDGGMQCIDHATCRAYFTSNYGCAVCLAICPFSQVGYDTVKVRFKGNQNAPKYRIVPLDEVREHETAMPV